MAEKLNTPAAVATQPKIDAARISQLENKLLAHMKMAGEYALLADDASAIFDSGLVLILSDKFLNHARDASKALTELRKLRGVLD